MTNRQSACANSHGTSREAFGPGGCQRFAWRVLGAPAHHYGMATASTWANAVSNVAEN